jgi:hypothetical protein
MIGQDILDIKEESLDMRDDNEPINSNNLMVKVDDMWSCTSCGHSRRQKSHVREHVESVHLRVMISCPICDKKVLKSGMRSHKKNHQKAAAMAVAGQLMGNPMI